MTDEVTYCDKTAPIFSSRFSDFSDEIDFIISEVVEIYILFDGLFKKHPQKRDFLSILSKHIATMSISEADVFESQLRETVTHAHRWFNFLYEYAHCSKYPDGKVIDITKKINPGNDADKAKIYFEMISVVSIHCIRELAHENAKAIEDQRVRKKQQRLSEVGAISSTQFKGVSLIIEEIEPVTSSQSHPRAAEELESPFPPGLGK